jgi:hypothetical protein
MDVGEVIEQYLLTGEPPPWRRVPPAARRAVELRLRQVLVAVVRHRAARAPFRRPRAAPEAPALAARIAPMLHGLLEPGIAARALAVLPGRLVIPQVRTFAEDIDQVDLPEAWSLANLLLDDLGAPPISDDTPVLDGLCAAGRAFVAARAVDGAGEAGGGRDVVVHELAHLLHTLPGGVFGVSPADAPLLRVPPARQEPFAWAAERLCCRLREGRWPPLDAALHDRRVDLDTLRRLSAAAEAAPAGAWAGLRRFAEEGVLPTVPPAGA